MDVKKDSASSEIATRAPRLSLRRESVRTLGVQSGIRTGSDNCGPESIICVVNNSGCSKGVTKSPSRANPI